MPSETLLRDERCSIANWKSWILRRPAPTRDTPLPQFDSGPLLGTNALMP
jgi:hypothetical protein